MGGTGGQLLTAKPVKWQRWSCALERVSAAAQESESESGPLLRASRPLLQPGWSVLAEAWKTRPEVTRQLRMRLRRQRSCQGLHCP